jgi:hypothetical protein
MGTGTDDYLQSARKILARERVADIHGAWLNLLVGAT